MTTQAGRVDGWPQALDYNVAIQAPAICFRDPELRESTVERHPVTRMPKLWTGGFADVYRLRRGSETLAIKCFKRSSVDVRERYTAIAQALDAARLPYFVEFRFLADEMLVNGLRFPVVKMRWADGVPLHEFVRDRLSSPSELRALAAHLVEMVHSLEANGLAHGDLQHGNILVGEKGLTLVDYDGMYVRAFEGGEAPELGLPNYQHPMRTAAHYGTGVDRFPLVVLCTGLHALAADPSLWERFKPVDTESLLFTRDDYLYPEESVLVSHLRTMRHPQVAHWLEVLLDTCSNGPESSRLPEIPDASEDSHDEYVPSWAMGDSGATTHTVPWWVSIKHAPGVESAFPPVATLQPIATPSEIRPTVQFGAIETGTSLPLGKFSAVAAGLAMLLLVMTGWMVPGATLFFMLIVAVVVAATRWRNVLRSYPPVRIVGIAVVTLLLAKAVPVHLFIALLVTAGSLVADRYSKWKKSASSRYGRLTSRFADLVSMVQTVDGQRSAVELEILALNRAEVNEKNSSLLYLRRRAVESGTDLPLALPPDLDRAITSRYQLSRRTHTGSLATLTKSLSELHDEQRAIAAELDTLQAPSFFDFLTTRSSPRS
jgi:hypothetical protein